VYEDGRASRPGAQAASGQNVRTNPAVRFGLGGAPTPEECQEEVEERTEELEERIDAHADALPVRFGPPRLGKPSESSTDQAGGLSGQSLMMFPAISRQK
jgi:hypothetical protein